MTTTHTLEYSKSSRAKCYGPPPCKGSCIDSGVLRYGQTRSSDYGDTVEWRHWGCVTADILIQLAVAGLEDVNGFESLKREDQNKVRKAIATRRVDPADIPATAKTSNQNDTNITDLTQRKRKAAVDEIAPTYQSQYQPQYQSQYQSQSPSFPSTPQAQALTQKHGHKNKQSQEDLAEELYCALTSKIVGVQYYKGLVAAGEQVMLVREPGNPHDRNAIQVKNIAHAQVGHIPRDIASKLAPLLDRKMITVEGVMLQGNLTGFSYALSVQLKIYGPSDQRHQLEPLLTWATPGQRGFPPRNAGHAIPGMPPGGQFDPYMGSGSQVSKARGTKGMTAEQQEAANRKMQEALRNAAELKQMLSSLEKVDDEGRRNSLLDSVCSKDDILNLPVHPNPPSVKNGNLMVDLLKHQSQALQWCIEHEYPKLPETETDRPVQFWQLRQSGNKKYYYNIATKTPQETPPILGRGALCADSMGLGKTLTMLALILATSTDRPTNYCASTLIVVPLSVLSNWEKQIQEHCVPEVLSYCVYYGATRTLGPEDLQSFDIVLTTYQTVTGEHGSGIEESSRKRKKIQRSLYEVDWKRIILDEGHTIRNPKTKMAKAVCGLNAQRRWVLSGTPIINSPRDLGSILSFLQVCRPLDNEDFFKRLVLRPLKDGDPEGAEILRALMSQICIRRTKEMQDSKGNHLIALPPVEMTLVRVALDKETRVLYDAVEDLSKKRIVNQMNDDGNPSINATVLSLLTRMRQIVLHPGLIPPNYLEQLRKSEEEDALDNQLGTRDKARLQALLAQAVEDSEECPICFGILSDPRITTCGHPFCLNCITEVIARDLQCPMDRLPLGLSDLVEPPPPTELTQVTKKRWNSLEADEVQAGSSAKIDQLVNLLKLTPPMEKSLVFSQFTSFLDKIGEALDREGIAYLRFDGTMSAKRRQETIDRFCVPLDENQNVLSSMDDRPSRSLRSSSTPGDTTDEDDLNTQADGADYIEMEDDSISDCESVFPVNWKDKGKNKFKQTRKVNKPKPDELFYGDNPKVLLLSLKAGALGLNLTVANNVYLMDPWWQEGIESQAIDRCNRLGQKKTVHVYQLIAEDTVESKVMAIQERKKLLIQQAFSGIKRVETQRERREARMQDLIELFGIRRRASYG